MNERLGKTDFQSANLRKGKANFPKLTDSSLLLRRWERRPPPKEQNKKQKALT